MSKQKQQKRESVMKDMNEFLVMYASQHLNNDSENSNLAEIIYNTIKDNKLENLDKLFNDNGIARTENYKDIARGFIIDFYNPKNQEEVNNLTNELVKDAIKYLGQHLKELDQWRR